MEALKVYDYLKNLGIDYQLNEHEAVYTVEAMESLGLDKIGTIVKNLFLRDAKGKRHFLVMLGPDKKVDLKSLKDKIGSTPLRFASEERLWENLRLTKGAVSPFGLLNEEAKDVEIVVDSDLKAASPLGVHPNDNTATVWISWIDLEKVISSRGYSLLEVEI